jgi:hypothetical protein
MGCVGPMGYSVFRTCPICICRTGSNSFARCSFRGTVSFGMALLLRRGAVLDQLLHSRLFRAELAEVLINHDVSSHAPCLCAMRWESGMQCSAHVLTMGVALHGVKAHRGTGGVEGT